jgi:hypothetical protein
MLLDPPSSGGFTNITEASAPRQHSVKGALAWVVLVTVVGIPESLAVASEPASLVAASYPASRVVASLPASVGTVASVAASGGAGDGSASSPLHHGQHRPDDHRAACEPPNVPCQRAHHPFSARCRS